MDSDPFSVFEFVSPFVDVDASADVKYEQSITFLAHVRYYHRLSYMCSFYCHQNKREKMSLSPILSVIHTITIATMQNFNSGNNKRAKNVTCKQTLRKKVVLGYLFKN